VIYPVHLFRTYPKNFGEFSDRHLMKPRFGKSESILRGRQEMANGYLSLYLNVHYDNFAI